jgi:hypothetical protein
MEEKARRGAPQWWSGLVAAVLGGLLGVMAGAHEGSGHNTEKRSPP